jgi:hypothetical protein
MAQIIKHSVFNPTLLTVNGLRRYGNGGKFCPVSYGPNNQAINLQTPFNLFCPFGVSVWDNKGEKSYSINVSFQDLQTDPRMKNLYDTMLELDEYILDKATEKSLAWFGKPLTREVLAGLYRPLVKCQGLTSVGVIIQQFSVTAVQLTTFRCSASSILAFNRESKDLDKIR